MEFSKSTDSDRASYDNESKMAKIDSNRSFKSGISVVPRVRPLNSHELLRNDNSVVEIISESQIKIVTPFSQKTFTFNTTLDPEADQECVFENSGIKNLTELAFEGYACTCLVYGQTGSGKTYTMTGPPNEFLSNSQPDPNLLGICPRSFYYLFQLLKNQTSYRVYANYLEIYNEQVKDLLNPQPLYPLNIRWRKRRGFYVDNLFLIECNSADDLLDVLQRGMRNRTFTATNSNEFSSRSHCIFAIMIDTEMTDPMDESIVFTKHGKLTFVDLAGSEKMKNGPDVSYNQLQEANNINRSLLVLGNCISSLSDPKRRNTHIPFRDSKLTKLLAESLGGNGVTLMIACISPATSMATDSINTLRYATRALKIDNKPSLKLDPREKIIVLLKKEILTLRQENKLLKSQLIPISRAPPERCKESPRTSVKTPMREDSPSIRIEYGHSQISFDSITQNLDTQESNLNLCEMLQEYMIENENLRSHNLELLQLKERLGRELETVMKENEKQQDEIEKIKQLIPQNQISRKEESHPTISRQSMKSQSNTLPQLNKKKIFSKESLTIDLSDNSLFENSYRKIYDYRKRNSLPITHRRSFNNGTRLSPLNVLSDINRKNRELENDIANIEGQIKEFQKCNF